MSKALQNKFDSVSLIFFYLFIVLAFCFTNIFKHLLPFVVLIIFLTKKFFFKASFLRQIAYKESPILGFIAFQLFLIPIINSAAHGDLASNPHLQWINWNNSWIIWFCYLLTNYFLVIYPEKSSKGLIAILGAWGLDFTYGLSRWILNGFPLERWQGSSGNPQLWGVQASLMLLVWLIAERNKLIPNKILNQSLLLSIISGIILSGSMSNIIGLSFASLAWILPSAWLCLSLLGVYLLTVNFVTLNFILNFKGNPDTLKEIFHGFSHKFIPRIKLWLDVLKVISIEDIKSLWGIGLERYNDLIYQATAGAHKNIHSLYFQNWLIYGLLGLYMNFIFLFNAFNRIISNKFFLAIGLYALSSSIFDCALNFLEVQILFWIALPLVEHASKNLTI